MKPLDITGQRFGRFVALKFECARNGKRYWSFQCDCGGVKVACASLVKRGTTKSCGCLMAEKGPINGLHSKGPKPVHGLSKTPEYKVWKAMRQRCMNSRQADFPAYGGRGIQVCARWNSFENFIRDMGQRPPGRSIDRIDNDGNYEPSNCRWANDIEQASNRRPRTTQLEAHCGF